jgi:uncharacterized membrane protein YdbT with pleckstrin-like domain
VATEPVREQDEEIFFHGHPSWRSILGFYIKGLLVAIGAGAIAGVITALAAGHVQAGWIVAVVAAVYIGVIVLGALKRIQTTYTITSRRLTIRRGLLSRHLQETRLERVQNVNARQSVLERLLRVGSVDFDTAAGSGYDFAFRGVANPEQIVRTVDRAIQERQAVDEGAPHPDT